MNPVARRSRKDPVFLTAIGMAPVAIGSVCLSDALALGGSVAFTALAAAATAPFARRLVVRPFQRLATILVVAAAASLWALGVRALAPELWDRLQFWLALAGANCMALAAAGVSGEDEDLSRLLGRLVTSLLFFLAALALGASREFLSTGTISLPFLPSGPLAEGAVDAPLLRIAALPPGGFLVLGIGIALVRRLKRSIGRKA